jgi:signal transduction histidine kinase
LASASDSRVQVLDRGPERAGGWLESSVKLVLTFRTGLLLVTMIRLPEEDQVTLVVAALVVAGIASYILLRYWDRIGPALVRHPAYLATEIVLATAILVATGVDSPFFYYTVGTALLGGLLYGWQGAILFSAMLFGVYFWVLGVWMDTGSVADTFQTYAGNPALYFVAGSAGAGARRLLDRQAIAEAQLAEQERMAAAEHERARLARDLHDSLAKTVHGIGFAALGLARQIERDPRTAAAHARKLADDARKAAHEARELLTELRGQERALPLTTTLRAEANRWSTATGVPVGVDLQDPGTLPPVAARELEAIFKEALRNIDRHAHASRVDVHLRTFGERVVLTVRDDGDGFEVPDDLDALAAAHHFGLTGMRERAQLAGGDLSVESEPGDGCVISVWVPAPAGQASMPPAQAAPTVVGAPIPRMPAPAVAPPPAPSAPAPAQAPPPAQPGTVSGEPDNVPDRAVPGFTWQ